MITIGLRGASDSDVRALVCDIARWFMNHEIPMPRVAMGAASLATALQDLDVPIGAIHSRVTSYIKERTAA